MRPYISHKRATFDFEILQTYEAGIVLSGSEVKAVRNGKGSLEGGHIIVRGGEAFLVGVHIPPFQQANVSSNYDPEQPRKLLLHHKEITDIAAATETQGLTAIPIKLYNKKRNVKLEVGIARGKKKHDKRESIKARDTKRDIERTFKFKLK